MNTTILRRVAFLTAIALVLGGHGQPSSAEQTRLSGVINHYTASLDPGGPWHVSGDWSLALKGDSGRGRFSASLSMVRSDNPARAAHTHHVMLTGGDVTELANGFQISGAATMTSNGNVAGFSESPVDIQVTGGNGILFSNITVTFGGAAAGHFGDAPVQGVVSARR